MRFGSDNSFGVPEQMLDALAAANGGTMASYGDDEISKAVERRLGEIFECDVKIFLVATGTAANALSLSAISPPYGAILCHPESHIVVDECGAPEFYTGGAKLVGVPGNDGKIDTGNLKAIVDGFVAGEQHQVQLAALSLTQATEAGTVYTTSEIAALTEIARSRLMKVHMDGARFANAVVSGAGTPAELTWKAGVDVLSFGATKNGAIGAEAIVLFDRALADDVMFRRKRGGHLISKSRFVAAQFDAYLRDGLWLTLARHANGMARRLGEGIAHSSSARLAYPVEANEVFAILPRPVHESLQAAGAYYYEWPGAGPSGERAVGPDEILIRLVTSFETPESDVDDFLQLLSAPTAEVSSSEPMS